MIMMTWTVVVTEGLTAVVHDHSNIAVAVVADDDDFDFWLMTFLDSRDNCCYCS